MKLPRRIMLLAVFLVFGMSACTSVQGGDQELSFVFYDKEVQSIFLKELELVDVQYRVDIKGAVWYSARDEATVQRIKHAKPGQI